ncbi:Uncharacterized protein FWK35_00017055 [Aphis craccivora]|uniref:Uncharacterized protein n=1 Tax=Aphis craccivora TaxID=307492 RepID=A0A6G0ZMX2_APHCR|nr:Uncharacterized protein FWK35_00017055 [Aphis craccivora]
MVASTCRKLKSNYASVVVMVGDSTASSGAPPIIITTTRAAFQSWRTTSRSRLGNIRNRLSVAGSSTSLYNHPPHCSCFDRQTRSEMMPERSRKHVIKIRSPICQSPKLVGENNRHWKWTSVVDPAEIISTGRRRRMIKRGLKSLSSSTSHDRRGEYNNIKRIVDNILKAGLLMSTNERDRRTCGFCSADSFRRRQCRGRKKHSCLKHGSGTGRKRPSENLCNRNFAYTRTRALASMCVFYGGDVIAAQRRENDGEREKPAAYMFMYAYVLYGGFRKLSFRSSLYYNIILLFLERNKAGPPQRLDPRLQVSVLKRRFLNSAGKQTSDSAEIAWHDVCLAGYEGFELLGFKFEVEDTAFSMVATVLFMVLFYFGLYIRQCDELGVERFNS